MNTMEIDRVNLFDESYSDSIVFSSVHYIFLFTSVISPIHNRFYLMALYEKCSLFKESQHMASCHMQYFSLKESRLRLDSKCNFR